jgi:hypothetical protein
MFLVPRNGILRSEEYLSVCLVGVRRVVGTKTPPFDWVQGLFEEGAEDRGVYLAPIVGGGLPCHSDSTSGSP